MTRETPATKILREEIAEYRATEAYWRKGGKNPRATTQNAERAAALGATARILEGILARIEAAEAMPSG